MRRVTNRKRVERLMASAIEDLSLNLSGITVLTEAASAAFAATPLIAALAGADRVFAVAKNSHHGAAEDIADYVMGWASDLGVDRRVHVTTEPSVAVAAECSLVTNLGFVRPIDRSLIERLPQDAAIALMWEPWEFRDTDADLAACRERSVPILGTNENHPRLSIFRYVGLLVLKILLDADIEVFRSSIVVIGSDPFGAETETVLKDNGASILRLPPHVAAAGGDRAIHAALAAADAVVLVEHRLSDCLIGATAGLPVAPLADNGVALIHICGRIDHEAVQKAGIEKIPAGPARPGHMSLTTEFVGARPIVDLHTAGLRVGEMLVRGLRDTGSAAQAVQRALDSGLALDFDDRRRFAT